MTRIFISLIFLFSIGGCSTLQPSTVLTDAVPIAEQDAAQLYGELFTRLQLAPVFQDSKTFVDMTPRETPDFILTRFKKEDPRTKEELRQFVDTHFIPPESTTSEFKDQVHEPIDQHIKHLWKAMEREPSQGVHPAASLIPLPYSYVVPGGRFREIYYWDSYFTQLGLLADHEDKIFQNMVKNFEHLILTMGHIPNGNRDYYRGRSQPPFFSHMVALWQARFGDKSATQFLTALKKEHDFWMSGARAVRLGEDQILNRYWDDRPAPRPEAYREDVALAEKASVMFHRSQSDVYRDLRAAAESGWDFSTRWFADSNEFASLQTTALIPIDLNALLYHLENKISELSQISGDESSATRFKIQAQTRRDLIQRYLWDKKTGTFRDYNWRTRSLSSEITIALVVPLFTGAADDSQAKSIARILERDFLKAGGLVTSLKTSGQQWDAPNGWPPHQWMAYAGLKRYKEDRLANRIRTRWLKLNEKVYRDTGKMMEKYNVVNINLKSGGGEYPLQDGFGWTNGVYRALTSPEDALKHLGAP